MIIRVKNEKQWLPSDEVRKVIDEGLNISLAISENKNLQRIPMRNDVVVIALKKLKERLRI